MSERMEQPAFDNYRVACDRAVWPRALYEEAHRARAAEAAAVERAENYRKDYEDAREKRLALFERAEKLAAALNKVAGLIAANRLMLGAYSGVRHVGEVENAIKRALDAPAPKVAEKREGEGTK